MNKTDYMKEMKEEMTLKIDEVQKDVALVKEEVASIK